MAFVGKLLKPLRGALQLNQMKLYNLHKKQNLPITVDEAWAFLSSPKNLKTITPDYMGFNILSGAESEMFAGQIIQYIVTPVLGIKTKWVTEITHVRQGYYFVDEQRFGPYKMWHHEHLFIKNGDNTEVTDKVSFKVPFGLLGRIMTPIIVIPQLKKIFNYRYKLLEQKFNNG